MPRDDRPAPSRLQEEPPKEAWLQEEWPPEDWQIKEWPTKERPGDVMLRQSGPRQMGSATAGPVFYGVDVGSRLLLGTARYPSPAVLEDAVRRSRTGVVTVSLRRETAGRPEGLGQERGQGQGQRGDGGEAGRGGVFFDMVRAFGTHVLPNTAGCHTVSEAVLTARMARELLQTDWIKLEVIGHHDTLQPDVFALVEAARILSAEGFKVFPYTTDDLVVAERLLEAGCGVLMPWCAPIGSAMGPQNRMALRSLRAHFPDVPLIVDAGIGRPSHAAEVMELGYDAVLLNTAVAGAGDPVLMAQAFAQAIEAGRSAFLAGPLEPRDMAVPSTPIIGKGVFA